MKTCAKCKVGRPLDDFHNDRRHADGKNTWCKFCKNTWTLAQGRTFDPDEDEQQPKVCYTCKRSLRLCDFHRDKRRTDGRCPNCRECVKTTFERSEHKRPAQNALRLCPKCKTERLVSEFARDRNRSDGTAIHCKPCRQTYYKSNAATIQQKHREWAQNPTNQAKMVEWYSLNRERRFFYYRANNVCGSGNSRTNQLEKAIELARLWKRQRGVCAVTGWRLEANTAQIDHIQPRVNGGDDAIGNLRWVHRDVNYAKRDLTDEAFFRLCSAVVRHQRTT